MDNCWIPCQVMADMKNDLIIINLYKKGNYLGKVEACQRKCHLWSWRVILDFGWFGTERSRFPLHWHHFPDYWTWHVETRRNGSLRQLEKKTKTRHINLQSKSCKSARWKAFAKRLAVHQIWHQIPKSVIINSDFSDEKRNTKLTN